MTPSVVSRELTALLQKHNYSDAAYEPAVALVGDDKASFVKELLSQAQLVLASGMAVPTTIPRNLTAHTAFCNAFSEACGFPEECEQSMRLMLRDGHNTDSIADHYGWKPERVARFLNGDRNQYFP